MPSLDSLREKFGDQRFTVLTVNIEEDRELVEKFIKKNGYGFEVLLDLDGLAATHFNVTAHPSKFLIDPKGKIIGKVVGYRPWDSPEAIALIEKLLNQAG